MLSKKILVLLILVIIPALIKAQVIKWQADRPLTWADFKGKPDYAMNAGALTVWAINYTYNWDVRNGVYVVTFNIENDFDVRLSWVLNNAQPDYLSKHEQLHFDINELYTRKLAAAFHSAVYTSNIAAEIEKTHQQYLTECAAVEAKYDIQTEHSQNRDMQKKWALYIASELEALPQNY